MNLLTRFFFPSGAFAILAIVVLLTGISGDTLYLFAENILAITAVLGLFFTWRFGVSRQLFAVVMLLALGLGASLIMPEKTVTMDRLPRFYYYLAATLAPVHLALFAWWRERGMINAWGVTRIVWILFVPCLAVFVTTVPAIMQSHFVFYCFLGETIQNNPHWPLVPIVICGLSWAFILLMYIRNNAPSHEGFLWASVVLSVGFFLGSGPIFFQLTVSVAIITLLLSLIETGLFFAYRDELTGLPARRALNEQLQKLGGKYAIAMVDVDHFKKFNDRYGHDVGDEVLKMVATRLKKSFGKSYRYGGEEFTLIYPGREALQVKGDAEYVRELVEQSDFTIRKPQRKKGASPSPEKAKESAKAGSRQIVSVTISIGIAQRSGENASPEDVIKAADKALYAAKKNGRNRVEIEKQGNGKANEAATA